MNLLFVCSRNKWRSRTAETIFRDHQDHQIKSAGTAPAARIKVSAKLLAWADIIFAMEKKHKQRMLARFPEVADARDIIVLDIPDEYPYMDAELIEILEVSVSPYME